MKTATRIVPALAALVLLAGCTSAGDSSPESSAPKATPGPSSAVETSPSGTASESPSTQPSSDSIASGVDPFCTAAHEGYLAQLDLLDATERKSTETGAPDDSGNVSVMNAAALDMQTALADVRSEWTSAREHIGDSTSAGATTSLSPDEVTAAFDTYFVYADELIEPEATLAAKAGSIAEYDQGMVAILTASGATDALASGGQGLSDILMYTVERCGSLPLG
ncbi:hypothetical protein [Demequina sediminicola]|uniref:hypothetical protein n=1 Tax=Demequina sediminicola TaxID=1095026 RepID=UPI00128D103B|nr:hypothetical protein [Demequina sediminicola]